MSYDATMESIDKTIMSIRHGLAIYLQQIVNNSPKTYLITGRREQDKNGQMTHRSLFFCHYLNVVNYKHRKAITQIVLSCHSLTIKKLRWRRPLIPRAERMCRFCKLKVETPEHALLECESNIDLVNVHQLGLTQYLKKLIAS